MLYAIVAVLILIVDQGVKYWTTVTQPLNGLKELIPGVLALSNIHNTGAAFGLMDSWPAARIVAHFKPCVYFTKFFRIFQAFYVICTRFCITARLRPHKTAP